jgi:hypothetical protein
MIRLPAILNVINLRYILCEKLDHISLARRGLLARLASEVEYASLYCL